jgi:hypothetical protein
MRILAIGLALITLAGCAKPVQRFVPIGNGSLMALDTKTGQECLSISKAEVDPKDPGTYPMCVDLYQSY